MEAIVLAGGFGTRLAHIVSDVPKPMAPVCERPFLRFILDDLQAKGVEKVVLAVGYKQEVIKEYFKDGYRGMKVIYSSEDEPLFTGGAIKKALSQCKGDRVFVVNGDTYFDVDLKEMEKTEADIVVAVKYLENFERYGTVEVDNDRIIGFREKQPCEKGLINGGIYLIKKSVLERIEEKKFSFEQNVLESKYKEIDMKAYESKGYFIDIGIPEDYALAQETMKKYTVKNKAVFFDRDGTINVDINYLHRCEDLIFIDGMPQFIKKWNDWGYKVIVVTNQAGIARELYTEEDMRKLHKYMNEDLEKYGARIDAFYFCPHHPEFTGECSCRKPNPGMIERAIEEFDIEPKESLLFGDKVWDIEAGEKCGVMGVLVK